MRTVGTVLIPFLLRWTVATLLAACSVCDPSRLPNAVVVGFYYAGVRWALERP